MKKNILLKSLIIFLILIIYSCKTVKPQWVYETGNQKVEIEILNGNDYLENNKPIKTNFILTNIEPNSFKLMGTGIRLLERKDGTLKTEIKVRNHKEKDTFIIYISFGEKPEEKHKFYIPLKKQE